MIDTDQHLQVHTKEAVLNVEIRNDVTTELMRLSTASAKHGQHGVQQYYEAACRAIATIGLRSAAKEGTTLYAGDDFEIGLLAGKSARSVAQFLWRNGVSGGYMPCADGEGQPYSTKLRSAEGHDLCLSFWANANHTTHDVTVEPWGVEL